jgi:mRNA interferase MazF
MVMQRGEIWWASFQSPSASEPGFRRPVLVIQSNEFNESKIATVIVVAITSNLRLANAPGNIFVKKKDSRLSRDSVVNVSQILTVDKSVLTQMVGALSTRIIRNVENGLRVVLKL